MGGGAEAFCSTTHFPSLIVGKVASLDKKGSLLSVFYKHG